MSSLQYFRWCPNPDEPEPKMLDSEFRIPKSSAASKIAPKAREHWPKSRYRKIFCPNCTELYYKGTKTALIHQLSSKRVANQIGICFHPCLFQDARSIGADSPYAETEIAGNFLDGLAGGDHPQYLKLAG